MKLFFKSFVFTLACSLNVNYSSAQVNAEDSLTLVDLYNSTNGSNWLFKTGWLQEPVSKWYGIHLTADNKRVETITLNFNGMSGNLPAFKPGAFEKLTSLSLYGNQLGGEIPSSIGLLTELINLNLSQNTLTGGVPESLFDLIKINSLLLHFNQLSGEISSKIGNLTALTALSLSNNKFTGTIPISITNLSVLKNLNLGFNQLTGNIPALIGNLTALTSFSLKSNKIEGDIPASLANLTNLVTLVLSRNKLSGEIPSYFGNFINLTQFDIGSNNFTGIIPSSIGNLLKLQWLDLGANQLNGLIPASFNNLTKLRFFAVDHNHLASQIIPDWLQNCNDLTYLYLQNNQFEGEIPAWIGNRTGLILLYLGNNQLTGTIPPSIVNLTKLEELSLDSNLLTGPIPSTLANINSLTYLQLMKNFFTFDGMEQIVKNYSFVKYTPQLNIPIQQSAGKLVVHTGGTPSNNTYRWYKENQLLSTIIGDSTFTPTSFGIYSVAITNSIASALTLYSDSIEANISVNLCSSSESITSNITGVGYQWQVNQGNGFVNIDDNINYIGTKTITLHLQNIPASWYGHQYRCVVDGLSSGVFIVTFTNNWMGSISSAWEDPANWSCGMLPHSSTVVYVQSGKSNYPEVNSMADCKELHLAPGVSLKINSGGNLHISSGE